MSKILIGNGAKPTKTSSGPNTQRTPRTNRVTTSTTRSPVRTTKTGGCGCGRK